MWGDRLNAKELVFYVGCRLGACVRAKGSVSDHFRTSTATTHDKEART